MRPALHDIAIIGGGVIGAAVAHYLGESEARVALVESGPGPSGASVACDGFVSLQSKSPGPALELAKQSRDLYDSLADELGADIELETNGGLVVARRDAELEVLRGRARVLEAAGVRAELLSPGETLRLEPHLSPRMAGASYCALDAHVSPLALVRAFWASASRRGVSMLTSSTVSSIHRCSRGFEIGLPGRGLCAERLVIAAGAWSRAVAAMVGVDVPVQPRRGQLAVTEATPPILSRPVMTADYLLAKSQAETVNASAGTSLEQTAAGAILVGSTRELVGFDSRTTREGIQSVLARAVQVLPALSRLSVIRSCAGLRPYCELGRPMVGPAPGQPDVFIATGHEGDGIALAPATGKLIAAQILGVG